MANTQSVYYQRFKTTQERFWEKVDVVGRKENDCWEWQGRRNPKGYGMFYVEKNILRLSHRYAWEISCGQVPDGLQVLHSCDNPPCVNPKHLFLGTNQDNVDDKVQKGRMKVLLGDNHPNSKLSSKDVEEIFEMHNAGILGKDIAKRFGVTPANISFIINKKGWKHVTA